MKILLLGKNGQVGRELQRSLSPLGELRTLGRREADLTNAAVLRAAVQRFRPDVIVNAAAYTAVDRAEGEEALARSVNALAPGVLADEAQACGAWLVHYSTDYVFGNGTGSGIDGAHRETDPTGPLSVYGCTKLEGEERIRTSGARHLILRTSWVFGLQGVNFPKTILRLAKEREHLEVVADQLGAPTNAALLADVTSLALQRIRLSGAKGTKFSGTYHVAASGQTNWHAYACHVVGQALAQGVQLKTLPERIIPVSTTTWGAAAMRPVNSLLDTGKFRDTFDLVIPEWRSQVDRLITELVAGGNLWGKL